MNIFTFDIYIFGVFKLETFKIRIRYSEYHIRNLIFKV